MVSILPTCHDAADRRVADGLRRRSKEKRVATGHPFFCSATADTGGLFFFNLGAIAQALHQIGNLFLLGTLEQVLLGLFE